MSMSTSGQLEKKFSEPAAGSKLVSSRARWQCPCPTTDELIGTRDSENPPPPFRLSHLTREAEEPQAEAKEEEEKAPEKEDSREPWAFVVLVVLGQMSVFYYASQQQFVAGGQHVKYAERRIMLWVHVYIHIYIYIYICIYTSYVHDSLAGAAPGGTTGSSC